MISTILGGIGLFLLGMILMTDGLKAVAGDALKTVLARFTGGPLRAMASGAALTALVQSSSATTLATIGFVSAGLLTFPQALGVIFGINIGTTSTGWIVSLLGLKFKIAAIALPMIGVGALIRLLMPGSKAAWGTAIAGFGLIFVGIDVLQDGMSTLSEQIDPSSFPSGGFLGRIALVVIGIVMTVVMQSSSAAVATTLTALYSDAITLPQAAALVIGQNVGTTVKAALASIGGSIAVKRTAAAHILFNLVTAVVAFFLIPAYLAGVPHVVDLDDPGGGATAIALFHTAFNVLGVLIFFPILTPFSAWIMQILPERTRRNPATRYLDPTVAGMGPVAVEVARRALLAILQEITLAWNSRSGAPAAPSTAAMEEAQAALTETREFLAKAGSSRDPSEAAYRAQLSTFHALDHLDRLLEALEEVKHLPVLERREGLATRTQSGAAELAAMLEPIDPATQRLPLDEVEALSKATADWRKAERAGIFEEGAAGALRPDEMLATLEAIRWIDRVLYHSWRAIHHLDTEHGPASVSQPKPDESNLDERETNGEDARA